MPRWQPLRPKRAPLRVEVKVRADLLARRVGDLKFHSLVVHRIAADRTRNGMEDLRGDVEVELDTLPGPDFDGRRRPSILRSRIVHTWVTARGRPTTTHSVHPRSRLNAGLWNECRRPGTWSRENVVAPRLKVRESKLAQVVSSRAIDEGRGLSSVLDL